MSTDEMYDQVVRAISVASSNRQEDTLRPILPWFRKKSELMTSLGDDILLDILNNCEFRQYQQNSIIIQQGDIGHSFFITLKGTTRVYVHSGEDQRPNNSNKGEPPRETGKVDNEDYHHKFGTMVRTLGAGKSFGELALIHRNSIRKASVIAAESSDFIVINRELYTRCLKAAQERDLNERMSLVDDHFFFKKWNPRMKTNLAMSFRRTQYRFDSVLYKRGDDIKALMLVFKGQVLISLPVRDVPNHGRRHKTKTTGYKMLDLCYVGPGGFLGDYEILAGSSTYSLTAKSFSDCEVFEIDLKSYTKIFTRRNQEALNKMKLFAEHKLMAHCSRLHQTERHCLEPLLQSLREERFRSQGQGLGHVIGKEVPLNLWNTAWGPLIDQSGPGSLYYQLKEEERRRKLREKRNAEILRRRRSSTKKPKKRQDTATFDKPQETQPERSALEARVQSFLSSSSGILPNNNTSVSLPLIKTNSSAPRKTWTSHAMRELTPSIPRKRLVASAPLSDIRETTSASRQHSFPRFQVTAEEYNKQRQRLRREERRFYLSKLYI